MRSRLPLLITLAMAASAAGAAGQTVQESRAAGGEPVRVEQKDTNHEGGAQTISDRLALPASAAPLFAPASADPPHETTMPLQTTGRGTALAIVGGALFVGGLIAGGDAGTLMVIAGAGIGAYGLYLMLTP